MSDPGEGRLPQLAVICSVFNEEESIPLFHARMRRVFDGLAGRVEPRLYFVDNGCEDASAALITALHKEHGDVFMYRLSRNFGYQCAVQYGLSQAPGDLFVVIDVDCEDPPEMIPTFLDHHDEGYDIVYGERLDRPEGEALKLARKLFYRITRLIADEHQPQVIGGRNIGQTRHMIDRVEAEIGHRDALLFHLLFHDRLGFRRRRHGSRIRAVIGEYASRPFARLGPCKADVADLRIGSRGGALRPGGRKRQRHAAPVFARILAHHGALGQLQLALVG